MASDKTPVTSTYIPSSYPVMNTGIGMPYVALFTSAGYPIFNPVTNRPLGTHLTRFNFKYEVNKDDECRIEFHVGNYQVVDIYELQEGMLLCVQWGLIYPEGRSFSHKPQFLRIKEVDYTFDDNGTSITLNCKSITEKAEYLPQFMNPSRYMYEKSDAKTMVDYMDEGFGMGHDIGIVIRKFIKKEKEDNG